MTYKQLIRPNLDPVIYVTENGKNVALKSWAGWCLAYVEVAFGTARLYGSAWEAWLKVKKGHSDRQFPRNVYFPIWFEHWGTYGSPARYANWGHVAIALVHDDGSMAIWSSPAGVRPYADTYTSIEQIERVYSARFVGWSEDIAEKQVIIGGLEVTPEQSFAEVFIAIAQRWPTAVEVDAWRKSGLASYTWCQRHAPNPSVNDRVALEIYHQARIDAGHGRREDGSIYPAKEFAQDRLSGGSSFKQVITGDMAAYLGELDAKPQHGQPDPATVEKAKKWDQLKELLSK